MGTDRAKSPSKIAIGIAASRAPTWDLLFSLVNLRTPSRYTLITAGSIDRPLAIADAFNEIVRETLADRDVKWLLQLGDDVHLHPDSLLRLLSWDVPIVAALAFSRYPPVIPVLFRGYREAEGDQEDGYFIQIDETRQWIFDHSALWTCEPVVLDPRPDDALAEADFVGNHCMLIRRDVLEAIGDPWFERLTGKGRQGTGCDRDFCEKARRAGFDVYMDRSVVAGHMYGNRSVGALDFLAWDALADWNNGRWVIGGKYNGNTRDADGCAHGEDGTGSNVRERQRHGRA